LRFTKSIYDGKDQILTVLPTACWHVGHVNCRYDLINQWVNKLDYNHRGLLLGDLAEVATKTSIGKGLFETNMTPKKQRDYIIELLEPKAPSPRLLCDNSSTNNTLSICVNGTITSCAILS
jgi:hypothetical protein